jgi:hypothetical protein
MDFTRFSIKVNGGPVQKLLSLSSKYHHAVASIPAQLGITLPAEVEIWCEELLPDYGPYTYVVQESSGSGGVDVFSMNKK